MPVTIPGLPTAPAAARINGGPSTAEFFDFFFGDNGGAPARAYDAFFQWDVSGGSVDFAGGVGPGVFGAPPNDPNGRFVDLGGSTRNPGRFETRLEYQVVEGQTYNFTFDYRSIDGRTASATGSGLCPSAYANRPAPFQFACAVSSTLYVPDRLSAYTPYRTRTVRGPAPAAPPVATPHVDPASFVQPSGRPLSSVAAKPCTLRAKSTRAESISTPLRS